MESIYAFSSITRSMASITSSLGDLAVRYAEIEARSTLDEDHIDLLVAQAQGLINAAEDLKDIVYSPPSP